MPKNRYATIAVICGAVITATVFFAPTRAVDPSTNFVFVKTNREYDLIPEPMDPETQAALAAAYTIPILSHARRLLPRIITGAATRLSGYQAHRQDFQATQERINRLLESFGFVWDGTQATWLPIPGRKEDVAYAIGLGVNPQEWAIPDLGFASFNDFFTRELKDDARSIDDAQTAIVAPADSKMYVITNISNKPGATSFFKIKSTDFSLSSLLGNDELARLYEGGTLIIFRLSPYNYHHFHFFADAKPIKITRIDGGYESVNPISYKNNINPLTRNIRHIVELQTRFYPALFIIVGAFGVGSIVEDFTTPDGTPIDQWFVKGTDAGHFELGGSTVAVLFPAGTVTIDPQFIDHSSMGFETAVKVGQRIGTFNV